MVSLRNKVQVPEFVPGASGPSPTPTDLFQVTFKEVSRTRSALGQEFALIDGLLAEADKVRRLTGKEIDTSPLASPREIGRGLRTGPFRRLARQFEGEEDAFQVGGSPVNRFLHPQSVVSRDKETLFEIDAQLRELKKKHPEIRTLEEIFRATQEEAARIRARSISVSERADFFGETLVQFAGGAAGSFTLRDPFNIASLPFGGFGRTAVRRVLGEMAIGAGVETTNQALKVREGQQLLGLDPTLAETLADIGFVAGGAGVFRGLFEGAAAGFRKVRLNQLQENVTLKKGKRFTNKPVEELTNPELLVELQKIENPNAKIRAAINQLEKDIEFHKGNPFSPKARVKAPNPAKNPRQGTILHQANTEAAAINLGIPLVSTPGLRALGRTTKNDLFETTALGSLRELDPFATPKVKPFESSGRQTAVEDLMGAVIERNRDQFIRMDEISTKIQDLLGEIRLLKRLSREKGKPDGALVVAQLDERAAVRILEIDRELSASKPSRKQRAALKTERKRLLSRFDRSQLDQARKVIERRQQKAPRVLRAKQRQLRVLRDERERINDAINADIARRPVEPRRTQLKNLTASGLLSSVTRRSRISGQLSNKGVRNVEELFRIEQQLSDTVDDSAVSRLSRQLEEKADEIDLGLDEPVKLDLDVPVDVRIDEEGNVVPITRTVREIIKETQEDDALAKAMKECSI